MRKSNFNSKAKLFVVLLLFSVPCFSQNYTATDTPINTQNGGVIISTVNVPLVGEIGTGYQLESVSIDIAHSSASDLYISLVAPDGTAVLGLTYGNGGSGSHYIDTEFQDGFPSITTGAAPFTGTFEPELGQMATTFSGTAVNGEWELEIEDVGGSEAGTLNSFELTFCAVEVKYTNTSANTESVRLFIYDANGDEQLLHPQLDAGSSVVFPVPTERTVITRSYPHNVLLQEDDIVGGNCEGFVILDVEPCGGNISDADGDGLCDVTTTCTNGTGAFNVYKAGNGSSVLQSFATTFINGPFDNTLYTDATEDIVGYSTNKVYLINPASGVVCRYIFNNGWFHSEWTSTAVSGGSSDGMTWAALASAGSIVGVNGKIAFVLGTDGTMDTYFLTTGSVSKDRDETAFIGGALDGTNIADATFVGATSNTTFLCLEADGTFIEYAITSRFKTDYTETAISGGYHDGSTFAAENIVGASKRGAGTKVLIFEDCSLSGIPIVPFNNSSSYVTTPVSADLAYKIGQPMSIEVFPNPLGHASILSVDVQLGEAQAGQLRMIGLGKLIKTIEIDNMINGTYQVDMSNLPRGVYFLSLTAGKENKVIKVVK